MACGAVLVFLGVYLALHNPGGTHLASWHSSMIIVPLLHKVDRVLGFAKPKLRPAV